MFTAALVFSLAALVTSNIALRIRTPYPLSFGLGTLFVCGMLPICVFFSATVLELVVGLAIAVVATCLLDRRRVYLPISLAVFAAVFGFNVWYAHDSVNTQRAKYPMQSIENRLQERPVTESSENPLLSVSEMERAEELLDHRISIRQGTLKELHENTTRTFVSRPNFGVMRMSGLDFWYLSQPLRDDTLIPQPGERCASADVLESRGTEFGSAFQFRKLHTDGVLDFMHPGGFGYVKDRQHVAGFQSHRFSKVPGGAEPWRVKTLDLIGLVVHREPVAYVSDSLPQMDELRRVPTRRLFSFEEIALAELRKGDDLHAREMPDGSVRMVGAVRALKQCMDCHGGRRGDLLGAFSYDLRKN